ncbi:MAG: ABC transporter substrate-binding protein, partial [Crocosphaera sp.]
QFLANTQQQTALATQLRSFIPANREALIDLRLFPLQGILQKQTLSVTAFSLDETNKINAIRKYGRDLYKRVMAGAISPEKAVSQLTQTVNTQFKTP